MSDFGTIMDVIIAECREAVPAIPAGDVGAERGVRSGEEIGLNELPHVFLYSPSELIELLDFQQEQRTFSCVLDLWVQDETQEQLALKLDAIRDQLAGNRSLSANVDFSTVTERQIFEFPGTVRKVGRLIIHAVEVV